uniref:Uncharacterized protein n=1 Tax=Cacopsylla melanoneura TaxID=428564 RepID=A0A8D8SM66_9HEMI
MLERFFNTGPGNWEKMMFFQSLPIPFQALSMFRYLSRFSLLFECLPIFPQSLAHLFRSLSFSFFVLTPIFSEFRSNPIHDVCLSLGGEVFPRFSISNAWVCFAFYFVLFELFFFCFGHFDNPIRTSFCLYLLPHFQHQFAYEHISICTSTGFVLLPILLGVVTHLFVSFCDVFCSLPRPKDSQFLFHDDTLSFSHCCSPIVSLIC